MNFDFGFRVDLGDKTGYGHFFRCISVAEKLVEKNYNVIFLTNIDTISSLLKKKNISIYTLESKNEIDRINESRFILENIPKLIIDLPSQNEQYEKSFKNSCKTIVFDDLGNQKLFPDLLVNGSIVTEFQNYSFNDDSKNYLHGPNYIILRSEFELVRKQIVLQKTLKKILLTFGGSDDENLLTRIIPYFFDKQFQVTLVLGPSYQFENELLKLLPKNHKFTIVHSENNMAELFSKQDLVISSSGFTTYELACIGIPSIFIPADESQMKNAVSMAESGFGTNYGYWDDDFTKLDEQISYLSDYSIRHKMFLSGRTLIDGKGLTRVLDAICKL